MHGYLCSRGWKCRATTACFSNMCWVIFVCLLICLPWTVCHWPVWDLLSPALSLREPLNSPTPPCQSGSAHKTCFRLQTTLCPSYWTSQNGIWNDIKSRFSFKNSLIGWGLFLPKTIRIVMICSILDVARGNCLTSLDAVPVASVWLYYTGISLRDCGVCEEASLLCPWWRPGAKCVCCRLESAASTTHSLSQTVGCGWSTHTTKCGSLPCYWSFEGFWREYAWCCPSPLVRGDGCGSEGPLW